MLCRRRTEGSASAVRRLCATVKIALRVEPPANAEVMEFLSSARPVAPASTTIVKSPEAAVAQIAQNSHAVATQTSNAQMMKSMSGTMRAK